MAKTALQQISDSSQLLAAWRNIRANSIKVRGGTAGIDEQTPAAFRRSEKANIAEVSQALRSRSYRFRDLRPAFIEKPDNGIRVICVPTVRDRIVQRSLLHFLTVDDKCGVLNSVSYGFIKNRTVQDAAAAAAKLRNVKPWVYKTDITKFFDRLDRDELKSVLRRKVRFRSLHELLLDAASREIFEERPNRREKIAKAGIRTGRGIRQGMPLSPFFSNLYLAPFDKAIEKAGISMVRYADDLIFMCESEDRCGEIDEYCREHLEKLGLDLPKLSADGKTRVFDPDQAAEFLGLGLIRINDTYRLDLTPYQKEKIRRNILRFSDIEFLTREAIDIFNFGSKLDATIAGYLGTYANCYSFLEFQNSLLALRRKVIKRLFSDTLGVDFAALNEKSRSFLRLPG